MTPTIDILAVIFDLMAIADSGSADLSAECQKNMLTHHYKVEGQAAQTVG